MSQIDGDSLSGEKTPLLGMTLSELQDVVAGLKMPRFTAKQIAQWLYEKRIDDIDRMTNLSKVNRLKLPERSSIGRRTPESFQRSVDGTVKYLFAAGNDGKMVECVYIPDNDRGNERATLCVSSQIGCKMNCRFCMTGKQGFHGNLTANDILNQILSIPEADTLTILVYLPMGEPADNLSAVLKSVEILTSDWGMAWSPKRITVSSVGKLDGMRKIVDATNVHIALSVHTPFHDERERLMPVEKAYRLADVVAMLKGYDFAHQRRFSVEYIMWSGFNDDERHAEALYNLLKATKARVNLIRFHAIPGVDLRSSDEKRMVAFRDFLNSKGMLCTIRRSRGEDIMAACGMLAGKKLKEAGR